MKSRTTIVNKIEEAIRHHSEIADLSLKRSGEHVAAGNDTRAAEAMVWYREARAVVNVLSAVLAR